VSELLDMEFLTYALPPQVEIAHSDGMSALDVLLEPHGTDRLHVSLRCSAQHVETVSNVARREDAVVAAILQAGIQAKAWIEEETRRRKMLRGY